MHEALHPQHYHPFQDGAASAPIILERLRPGGRRIPASKFRQQVGSPLYTIKRPGKPPMLGANVRVNGARAGKVISLRLLRRGRNPGGRGTVRLVPVYVGVNVANIGKKFAILEAIRRAAARLPNFT